MDCDGRTSDQIDVLIYDPQYSPLLARTSSGDLFVPAEAIYAAFEVKQEMNKSLMDYAAYKIASVRNSAGQPCLSHMPAENIRRRSR